jgi:hypothetical protein
MLQFTELVFWIKINEWSMNNVCKLKNIIVGLCIYSIYYYGYYYNIMLCSSNTNIT